MRASSEGVYKLLATMLDIHCIVPSQGCDKDDLSFGYIEGKLFIKAKQGR